MPDSEDESMKRLHCIICNRSGLAAWVMLMCGHFFHRHCFNMAGKLKAGKLVKCLDCERIVQWSECTDVVELEDGDDPDMKEANKQIEQKEKRIDELERQAHKVWVQIKELRRQLKEYESVAHKAAVKQIHTETELTAVTEAVANNEKRAAADNRRLANKLVALEQLLRDKDKQLEELAQVEPQLGESLARTNCPMLRKQDDEEAKMAAMLDLSMPAKGQPEKKKNKKAKTER